MQGCCQHAIAVADVRRVHATDPQRRDQYPFLVFQAQPLKRKCRICKHRAAMKVPPSHPACKPRTARLPTPSTSYLTLRALRVANMYAM